MEVATKVHPLSLRANWEAGAVADGSKLEETVAQILRDLFAEIAPDEIEVSTHPSDLQHIYLEDDYAQDPAAYAKPAEPQADDIWYDPERKTFMTLFKGKVCPARTGGCIPDVKLKHRRTGNVYYIECKKQNDAGNAHERCAKYATPSMIALLKQKLGVTYHPVGYIFSGALVEKRKYIVELKATYRFAIAHLLLWKKERDPTALRDWATRIVLRLLRDPELRRDD